MRKLALDCKFSVRAENFMMDIILPYRFVAELKNERLRRYLYRRREEAVTDANKEGDLEMRGWKFPVTLRPEHNYRKLSRNQSQ